MRANTRQWGVVVVAQGHLPCSLWVSGHRAPAQRTLAASRRRAFHRAWRHLPALAVAGWHPGSGHARTGQRCDH